MSKYVIGLDLGINNVGWSIVDLENKKIEKSGVRLFYASDSASERRNYRSVKRRKKRKHNRIKDILNLFDSISFPTKNTVDNTLLSKRVQGLNHKISEQDIVNIVCYYASHRGYIPFGDEERELIDLGGLYPCEYYANLLEKTGKYRALEQVIDNKDLMKEYDAIITKQSEYYSNLSKIKTNLSEIIIRKRKFWEGPGSEKSRTDYGRFKTLDYKKKNGIIDDSKFLYDDLIGRCSICINEKTVPVSNYYYEVFNLLNDFINTSIISIDNLTNQNSVELDKNSGYYKLTTESLNKVIDYCKSNSSLQYSKIYRDLFGLKKEDINGYRVDKNHKPLFSIMNFYRKIVNSFERFSKGWIEDIEQYNEVIRILAISPGIVETKTLINESEIIKYKFSEEEFDILKDLSIKLKKDRAFNYGSLSEKALKMAIKDMLSTCKNFMQVRREFDYDKEARNYFINTYKETEGMLLMDSKFVDDIIASPQVKKSLRQAIKIINAIIEEKKEYPNVIAVESTHEMNGNDKKRSIEKEQKQNEQRKKEAQSFLEKHFDLSYVTDVNIMKIMLYNELDGRCPYCGGEFKDGLNSIIKSNIEIEHILPLSKSYDDSYNNKTLACRNCNSAKGNNTPYLWMGSERFEDFSNRIQLLKISPDKKNNFLETRDLDKYNTRFFHRNLRDTAYATSELINQINIFNDFVQYKLDNQDRIKTLSTPGQLTSKIRKNLNIEKDRDAGKFHHALDASIVAGVASDDYLGRLLIESQNDSQFWIKKKYLTEKIDTLLLKYNKSELDNDLRKIKSDADIKISNQVNKDFNRSMSNSNIYKYLKKEDGFKKVNQISNIYDENLMNDKTLPKLFDDLDTTNILMIKDNNPKMYEKLKKIYASYRNKGTSNNPFINYCLEVNNIQKEEFDYRIHGIKQEGGPVIKKLRYYSAANSPAFLTKKNMNMKENTYIGLDSVTQAYTKVYWDLDKKKFIFLPIYVTSIDFKTGKINKNDGLYQSFYDLYLKDKNYKFIVDLYNGNLIEVEKKNDKIKGFVSTYDKDANRIRLKSKESFTCSDKCLKVYDVDYLGNEKNRLTWPSK